MNHLTANTKTQVKSFFLNGPAGRLEALLNTGAAEATHSALVCHPHPLYGGTLHNKVVFHTMKALNRFGFPVLRFNFRGAGLSEGKHDSGVGEVEDVRTALDWLYLEFRLPIVFAGFSFGAATGLKTVCFDARVSALIAVGLPVHLEKQQSAYNFLERCGKPKLFLSGGSDQFGPRPNLERLVALAAEPKQFVLVDEADHFLEGHLPELRQQVENWVKETFGL